MTAAEYLANRRPFEIGIIAAVILISLFANVGVVWMEFSRSDEPFETWLPWVLEGSSHIGLAVIFPMIIWLSNRYPIRTDNWQRSIPLHALFSVAVSLIHVVVMYVLRVYAYRQLGDFTYHWPDWWNQFLYEYLKDFRTYMLILLGVNFYQFLLLRWQGEAGYIDNDESEPENPAPDRFLVKKLGREFLVRFEEIDWIEAAGNYVNLHVKDRVYPLRDTMTNISDKLTDYGFQRVHRSAIVNLDCVAEIVSLDSGDGEARLKSTVTVPVSRRFRKDLRARLA